MRLGPHLYRPRRVRPYAHIDNDNKMNSFNCKLADQFINSLSNEDLKPYAKYWTELTPRTPHDCWLRWVFSFMSIHTTWSSNVKGYLAVKEMEEGFTKRQLKNAVVEAGVGLHKMRTEGIWDFTRNYRVDPDYFVPTEHEDMVKCRNKLAKCLYGIGMAKTSFAFELIYPLSCDVVCVDTHMLRLYGSMPKKSNTSAYMSIEKHWRDSCNRRGLSPTMARHAYWDRLRGKTSNKYWAWCLEGQTSSAELNLQP